MTTWQRALTAECAALYLLAIPLLLIRNIGMAVGNVVGLVEFLLGRPA